MRKPKYTEADIKARKGQAVEATDPEDAREKIARLVASPEVAATRVIQAAEGQAGIGRLLDTPELLKCLHDLSQRMNHGDMSHAEAMLMNQATALQSLFARLTERGMGAEYVSQLETYMKLALRAQSQCRATLEAISAIKNPPMMGYVKQANIAHGPQQVNNGRPNEASHTRENQNQPTQLLEQTDGNRLDTGATGTTGKVDPTMATVGAVNGTKDARR